MMPLLLWPIHISMNMTPLPWYGAVIVAAYLFWPVILVALIVLVAIALMCSAAKNRKRDEGAVRIRKRKDRK